MRMDLRGKIDQLDEKLFLVHYHDEFKLADLISYNGIELGGAYISAAFWVDGIGAVGRLRSVWVKIRDLPLHLVRWYVLAQVISSMGKLKDIDLSFKTSNSPLQDS
uniref:Uncharacterized protein n=1 Tax=Arundo donax TaxID=35708 RepID=A0A0A8ZWX1_ARUDO